MPTIRYRLELDLNGRVEQRGEDYWAARAVEFGITTYGKTSEESQRRLERGVDMLLDDLMKRGPDAVRETLNRLGIQHILVDEVVDEPRVRQIKMPIRRQLVPA